MKSFAYVSALTEAGAVELLGEDSRALAGGTALLNLMKDRVVEPALLVNLKSIPGLSGIEGDARAGARIGANSVLADLIESPVLREGYPALVEALREVGTPQIRNSGTLGGNLCGRPPCWYFRSESFNCRKKGGPDCPAEGGENDGLSILAHHGLPCHAVHASSAAPALIAYGGKVRIVGPQGPREVDLEEFFVLPEGANVVRENVLGPKEIVTHVSLPPFQGRSATYEVRERDSRDWPLALVSVALSMEGDTCRTARICLGAVAPVPLRSKEAEAVLRGRKVDEEAAGRAAAEAVAGAKPMERNGFKVAVARTAVMRGILKAAGLPPRSMRE